jgi:hypothetical protein
MRKAKGVRISGISTFVDNIRRTVYSRVVEVIPAKRNRIR